MGKGEARKHATKHNLFIEWISLINRNLDKANITEVDLNIINNIF